MPVLEELQRMSEERFLAVYQALSNQGFGPLDPEIARDLKFRPQSIKKLPMAKRAQRARKLIESRQSIELAYDFFGKYLVQTHRELVTGFLDKTGVPHEEGMIEDLDAHSPAADKIAPALQAMDAAFEADDVTMYLALCAEQWPENEPLQKAWQERAGVSAS